MKYWLMKTEPDVFSIDDLKRVKKENWDGVRNYQARNFMRDEMKKGDGVLIYHSNAKPSGVAGLAKVSREAIPDSSSWDPSSQYYDPKSTPENPRWFMVEVQFVKKFARVLSLAEMKKLSDLSQMMVLQKGSRLSIQPVAQKDFEWIDAFLGES